MSRITQSGCHRLQHPLIADRPVFRVCTWLVFPKTAGDQRRSMGAVLKVSTAVPALSVGLEVSFRVQPGTAPSVPKHPDGGRDRFPSLYPADGRTWRQGAGDSSLRTAITGSSGNRPRGQDHARTRGLARQASQAAASCASRASRRCSMDAVQWVRTFRY